MPPHVRTVSRPFASASAEEKLELAHLVARLGAAGRVVALDPDFDADELVERRPPDERRRAVHELESRQALRHGSFGRAGRSLGSAQRDELCVPLDGVASRDVKLEDLAWRPWP